jgi:hypothetical protein
MKHPEITVQLVGRDGNAFAIIGTCVQAMKEARLPAEEVKAFQTEAMSGDYDKLLRTCMDWFDVT